MVVLTSRQPVAALTTTGSLVPMSTWRTTMGAPQPAHMRWPPASSLPLRHQLEPLLARVLEVVGLLEGVDRADVDALAAHDAAALVDAGRSASSRSLKVSAPVGQRVTQRPQRDAVGQLQGLAVGRVDVHREAAAGEVVAGRAGHVAADAHAAPAGDAAVHVAADEGVLVLGLDRAHQAALDDELVVGDAVLDAELLQVAGAEAGALALQAAHGLGAGGGQAVALLDLDVGGRAAASALPTLGMVARAAGSALAPILSHTGSRSARRWPQLAELLARP